MHHRHSNNKLGLRPSSRIWVSWYQTEKETSHTRSISIITIYICSFSLSQQQPCFSDKPRFKLHCHSYGHWWQLQEHLPLLLQCSK